MAVGSCAEKLYEQVYQSSARLVWIADFFLRLMPVLEAYLQRPGSLDGKAHDAGSGDSVCPWFETQPSPVPLALSMSPRHS
jgi:hypothetical protein